MKITILLCTLSGVFAYMPVGKNMQDAYLSGVILRELAQRMGKDLPKLSYLNFPEDNHLALGSRSLEGVMDEAEQTYPLDYDGLEETNMHPSLRDREFLEHSSLWGKQYMSGGAGEGKQLLRPEGTMQNIQEVKSDSTLPAYCNPPNPCPEGYTSENNCLEEFENTAVFSRNYQGAQDCMCDTEHMFDCPGIQESQHEDHMNFGEVDFNRLLQHSMKMNSMLQHKTLVAKKFHQNKKSIKENPFLSGERLPVAAKKGNNVLF